MNRPMRRSSFESWDDLQPRCIGTHDTELPYTTVAPQATRSVIFESQARRCLESMLLSLAYRYNELESASISPSLHAVIDGAEMTFNTLREKIDALEASWRAHNAGKSIVNYNHFSYYQIIGAGPFAVPLLLEKVERGSNSWFVALKAISGIQNESEQSRANPRAARDSWIEWGRAHEFFRDSSQAHGHLDRRSSTPSEPRSRQSRLE